MSASTDEAPAYPGDTTFAVGFGLATLSLIPAAAAMLWMAVLATMKTAGADVPVNPAGPLVVACIAIGMAVASMPIAAVWWWQSRSDRGL